VHGNLAHRDEVAHPAGSNLGREGLGVHGRAPRVRDARLELIGVERVLLLNSLTSRRRGAWLRLVAKLCLPLTLAHASLPLQAQEAAPAGADHAETAEPLSGTPPPPRAALDHYEKGRALYLAGRYREAVVELEQALTLDPDSPNLVYNLAHVYELLGELDPAIRHYKHYRNLLSDADAAERARVDGTLQRLEGARDEVVDPPSPPPPPPAAPQRGVADAAFWSVTALAASGLVTGGVLGVMALDAENDAQGYVIKEPGDERKRADLIDRTNRLALASDISLLAGAVLGTTAILLFALRTKPAKNSAAPRAAWSVDANKQGAFLLFRRQL
jgi:tetratricopeptide (TPR) repeat protein